MVPFHEHVRILHLSARARLEAYSRLFRFTTEEDINPKDFAEKTGMAIMSVNSMIQHAKLNAKLYEEMIELGYSDDAFPVWWYSPAREGTTAETVEQPRRKAKKSEEGVQKRRKGKAMTPHPLIYLYLRKVDQLYLRLRSDPMRHCLGLSDVLRHPPASPMRS